MSFLEILELAVKAIVGGVGNLGLSLEIVETVVAANLREKPGVALGGSGTQGR